MSDLHLSLIVIGLIFIAAVVLFNRWQERKYRRQAEKMFRGERQDVLFEESPKAASVERIEPSFGVMPPVPEDVSLATPDGVAVASGWSSHEQQPERRASSAPVQATEAPAEEAKPHRQIDEAIDLIGVIQVSKPVLADSIKGLITRAHTFSKPVHWEGAAGGQWVEISPGGQYNGFRTGLQLADRRGPVTNAEISRFIALVKQFAVELGGDAQAETEESAAARATELDGFCADVDVEIGVNLVAGDQAIPGTKLRALAEASGLTLNPDGVFYFHDTSGALLFTLRNSEPRPFLPDHVKNISTRGITLLLDVPRVAQGIKTFDQMLRLGRHIAQALGGDVVDDNGKPLTDAGADAIRRQLSLIYREMDGFGTPAGSVLALRLFS